MGLVVQAPMDALLPTIDVPVAVAVAPAADGGPAITGDGLFASLLASLSATLDTPAETTELSETLVDPGDIAPKDGEDKNKADDPFAALFAAALPLQVVQLPQTPEAEAAPKGGGAATVPGIGTSVQAPTYTNEAVTPAIERPVVASGPPAAEPAAPVASPTTNTTVAATLPVTSQPDVQVADPAAAPLATAASATAPPAVPAAPAASAVPRTEPAEAPPPESSPPGDGAVATEATSVVRSVGNAETEDEMGAGSQPQARQKDKIEGPQPRASAQGIAHAAPNSAVGQLRQAPEATPAQAQAPVQEPPVAPSETVPQVDQVATTVIERVEAGGGEARIHLDPVDLGEVTIHVRTDGDSVRIEIRAERQEAMNLLRDHTQDLSTLLGERGLNLSDVNVGLGRGSSDQTWGQDSRPENRPANGEFASILGLDEAPASIERHQRLRAAYNPDGAHIYRV